MIRFLVLGALGLLLIAPSAHGQSAPSGDTSAGNTSAFQRVCTAPCNLPNQEIRIRDLPLITAPSTHRSGALAAALEIILHDREDVCCGKDSALEDSVLAADSRSLREVAAKLQGRHLLSDGRPVMVTADYISEEATNPGKILGPLHDNHALLMQWNSHFYVLYGVVFDEGETGDGTDGGGVFFSLRKLLLLDPRFSDERRQVVFNRQTDDWTKVLGLLQVTVAGP